MFPTRLVRMGLFGGVVIGDAIIVFVGLEIGELTAEQLTPKITDAKHTIN
jgi:hypothetical protein